MGWRAEANSAFWEPSTPSSQGLVFPIRGGALTTVAGSRKRNPQLGKDTLVPQGYLRDPTSIMGAGGLCPLHVCCKSYPDTWIFPSRFALSLATSLVT